MIGYLPNSQLLKFALCSCMACAWLSACGGSDPQGPTLAQNVGSPAMDAETSGDVGDIGPEGDSRVKVGDRQFPLKSALGDIWGPEGDHYNVDFTITDGKFLIAPTEIDGVIHSLLLPVQASASIHVELYSPGDSFLFGTYSYSPFGSGGGVLAGTAYFDSAYVGVDLNDSGDVETDENFRVIGGTFDFKGELPNIELSFSVTLENGLLAEGHYTGLFDFAERI